MRGPQPAQGACARKSVADHLTGGHLDRGGAGVGVKLRSQRLRQMAGSDPRPRSLPYRDEQFEVVASARSVFIWRWPSEHHVQSVDGQNADRVARLHVNNYKINNTLQWMPPETWLSVPLGLRRRWHQIRINLTPHWRLH
jgi:hypothetical protein